MFHRWSALLRMHRCPRPTNRWQKWCAGWGRKNGRLPFGLRKQTVEPVFGIIKRVMGWAQMSMRGLAKARGEWSLVTMAWNIKRLHVLRAA